MPADREFVPNQVFVGLPWRNVRKKYENVIRKLEKKYPVYFTIVGRGDGQDADDLLEVIKQRISSSSYAIFDATGGNANVSLEFGFAEAIAIPRSIYLSAHGAAKKVSDGSPIISDLGGKKRVQYTNENKLKIELEKFCRDHDFTKRFEAALRRVMKNKKKGAKKRGRALAIKMMRALDGRGPLRRAELVQNL